MHNFIISDEIKEKIKLRRDKVHPFTNLNPNKTALIVVDMQNAFVEEGAGHAWVPSAAGTCSNINRISETIRTLGGLIFWVLNTFTNESLESWSYFHKFLSSNENTKKRSMSMTDNSYGHKLYKDLNALDDDIYIKKTRYSAFIKGSSDIDKKLRLLGIENLLITGTATNVCCESTARDAMMLNYKTLMISDACSANSDKDHTSSLLNFLTNFGDVRTTNEIIEILKDNYY